MILAEDARLDGQSTLQERKCLFVPAVLSVEVTEVRERSGGVVVVGTNGLFLDSERSGEVLLSSDGVAETVIGDGEIPDGLRDFRMILPEARGIYGQWSSRARTPEINRIVENALKRHQPPLVRGKRLKIYYIAQIRTRPPTFACVVNDPSRVRTSYRRYLTNRLRDELGLSRTPIRLRFKPRKQKGSRG